ncbi:hypothetical protein DXG03_002674 [Asterophora parasitica]|uniref:Aspartate aminotransferase n=1 Tax=Asterophora parasitica TaxID=117018 RepID=A0A9P7GBT9_9AGAR|nr:hypothetical protein DXG03_002674 [Asterophora parasitica]
MSAELWQDVPLAPPDSSIFKLTAAFKADTFDKKVNLGVGAYRDDNDKPWVLPVASQRVLSDHTLDHEYLPITGLASFTSAAAKLILGQESPAIAEQRAVSVQTISGTGANHLGALFLARFYNWNGAKPTIYLSNPSWANHNAIFNNVGIEVVDYPYYDPKTIGLDFTGFIGALQNAPERSVFLLHACAHNPTGVDPTEEQWEAVADIILAKKHYAFFDCAYQGFASGDLSKDNWAVRRFVEKGVALLVCQSFAKNAGLYGERVGALHVVSRDKETADRVRSQLSVLQRSEISNPPTYGARVVSLILNDEQLLEEWKEDIRTMAGRIIAMRTELHRLLTEELKTPGNWDHIVKQIGMFSFTGINAAQSKRLVEEHHVYLTANGRISMAGLNTHNIRYFAQSLDAVVTPHEAIEYVLPLLSGLAMDQDDQVKEALAAELVALIWWFFTNCKIIPDELHLDGSSPTDISVQAFTPILGTLLLSANPLVGGAARNAIVDLLSRLKKADDSDTEATLDSSADEEDWTVGSFTRDEREMVRSEILQQVVIGMGRLDVDPEVLPDEMADEEWSEGNAEGYVEVVTAGEQGNGEDGVSSPREIEREASEPKDAGSVNPYFPVLPASFHAASSPASSLGSTPSTDTTEVSPSPLSASRSNSTLAPANIAARTQSPPHQFPLLRSSSAPTVPLSPTDERLLAQEASLHVDRRQTTFAELGCHSAYDLQDYPDNCGSEEAEEDEQAAVGRLSSMSLMAAVTASGALDEETKQAFVNEVERVAQDTVYWVRREASFALGALAKVVPEEIVIRCLVRGTLCLSFYLPPSLTVGLAQLPLFDNLRHDPVWHVRHSALFALPAILSRLSPERRQTLALDTLLILSTDESPAVRSGVLEALGEVLYTFREDSAGPPEQLVHLFLGRRDDRRVQTSGSGSEKAPTVPPLLYTNPDRPLICAFNYPAVALTLGRERWGELREVYMEIAANRGLKVRKTLAASLGELSKIVGKENAERDLVGVWWDAIRCEDEEVRTRALESVVEMLKVVGMEVGESIAQGLVAQWDAGRFRGWREREVIAKGLGGLVTGTSRIGLLKRALEDNVAAVREAAVDVVAEILLSLSGDQDAVAQLRAVLQSFAVSSLFRRRMTFIACQQALALHPQHVVPLDDELWRPLVALAGDPIVGVRIGLGRLVGSLSISNRPRSPVFLTLVARLSQDPSKEVQAYVLHPPSPVVKKNIRTNSVSTFSRPPPLPASPRPGEAFSSSSPFHDRILETSGSTDVTRPLRTYNGPISDCPDPNSSDHPISIDPSAQSFGQGSAPTLPPTESRHLLRPTDSLDFADTGGPHDDLMHGAPITSADADMDVTPNTSIVVPA